MLKGDNHTAYNLGGLQESKGGLKDWLLASLSCVTVKVVITSKKSFKGAVMSQS